MKHEEARICPSCGKPMELLGYKHVQHVGDVKVIDGTSFAWQCRACDEVDLSLDDLAGYEQRATALVLRDGHRVNGAVIKSARKALGLKQTEVAALLGCEPETVSRWETGARKMPRAEQLALVALIEGVERGAIDLRKELDATSEEKAPAALEVKAPRRTNAA